MKAIIIYLALVSSSIAMSASYAEDQLKTDQKQPSYEQIQRDRSSSSTFKNDSTNVQHFDGGAWAQCVLDAGLGSWVGSAFCAYGGLLHDVID